MNTKSVYTYKDGLKDGIPIALGYLFVSIGFGITAVNSGLKVLWAVIISMTNLTSAGQVAGVEVLSAVEILGVSAVEMAITQFVINIRYSLMGITLSQKLDDSFTAPRRLLCSYFITDEVFAVAAAKSGCICAGYMLGLGTLPFFGWASGTLIGALAASWMPREISRIFGIAVYGMFMSIVLPQTKKERGVAFCALAACVFSLAFYYLPVLSSVSAGFSVVICALLAACAAAVLFPVKEDEE